LRVLARALLETAAFIELSGEDVLELDAAVKTLESIADTLSKASPEERQALRSAAEELAAEYSLIPGFQDAAKFYAAVPKAFDL
jgi:hypothetical protein